MLKCVVMMAKVALGSLRFEVMTRTLGHESVGPTVACGAGYGADKSIEAIMGLVDADMWTVSA